MGVAIEIDEKIVPEIDALARNSRQTSADFVNAILRRAIRRESVEDKIRRHRESYEKFPQQPDEYEPWQDEQVWETE
jgi:hypothetical protein